MQIEGKSLIAGGFATSNGKAFHAANPATQENIEPAFYSATSDDVNRAAQAAHAAFCNLQKMQRPS